MKKLTFDVSIRAPRAQVWTAMLERDTYERWTAPFCEGSTFEGSWDEGATIRFLTPSGDGMVAEIAEHKPGRFVAIRHLGSIEKGVEDTSSEKVRAWAPAYETYRFEDTPDGCRVTVTLDTVPEYEAFMQDTYPKALDALKGLCEQPAGA